MLYELKVDSTGDDREGVAFQSASVSRCLAFSVGLAATITTIGLLAVVARRAFGRLSLDGPFVRALPAASAILILAVGVGITVNSLPEVL